MIANTYCKDVRIVKIWYDGPNSEQVTYHYNYELPLWIVAECDAAECEGYWRYYIEFRFDDFNGVRFF